MKNKLFGKKYEMKCYGSATVGERGQVVLPAEIRKQYGIEPGNKLIVMGEDYGGLQSIVLIKSEDVAKVFEHMTEIEKMINEGGKNLEKFKKEGLKGIQNFKESGIKNLGKKPKRKKKK